VNAYELMLWVLLLLRPCAPFFQTFLMLVDSPFGAAFSLATDSGGVGIGFNALFS
jgi:hypothetical protein